MRTPPGLCLFLACTCLGGQSSNSPHGWRTTPVGTQIRLPGDFPGRLAASKDGSRLFVVTSGYHNQGLTVIDIKSNIILSSTDLGRVYGDMAFDSESSRVYLPAGGFLDSKHLLNLMPPAAELKAPVQTGETAVVRGQIRAGKLSVEPSLIIPQLNARSQYTTGVALGRDGALFVVNINDDTVYRLSANAFTVEAHAKAGYGAYRVAVSPDGAQVAVSNWGDESVSVFAAEDLRENARIKVGIHPNDLRFGPDGRLYVANAGSNSVSIIADLRVIETVKTSLLPTDPVGSTPDAIAINSKGTRLYVANADNNDVAVIDVARRSHSEVEGFIPTGWYPSALTLSPDDKTLYVGIAKGFGSGANAPPYSAARPFNANSPKPYDFIGNTLTGYVSVVRVPTPRQLNRFTHLVQQNIPPAISSPQERVSDSQILRSVFPRIRHVLYIIRENRTYDQVLGDLGVGNGDPSLTLFGETVTPNAHGLAREWSLLDNLFVDGEVSENGHQWSDAAYATQFTSQAWLQRYSGRPEPKATESELGADERLRSSPAGYLWDNCARHGISFRTYGEYAYFHSGPDEGPRFVAKGLDGHASLEWLKVASAGWTDITKGRDTDLADVFIHELRNAEATGEWPRFMVMSLGEDHTHALRAGDFSPVSMVASNDQALGKIVEAVAHSRYWADTAIFVIEDDAQDGPDHVDCRRTEGFVISPYVKRHVIDSTPYTTASMIHTMELILGLPPMTQFDRAAKPMFRSFITQPDFTPYNNKEPLTDLFARNPAEGPAAAASAKLDFSGYDLADPEEMNRILWEALRPGTHMPAPVRSSSLVAERSAPGY